MRDLLSRLRERWLLVLLIVAFIVLLILGRDQLEELARTLIQGEWQWVLASILVQAPYYVVYSLEYKLAFATVGVESRVGELIPVLFASIFVRTVVPSAGVSGAALFVDDAGRRGQSPARAAEGALLVLASDLGTVTPLLLYGLVYLSTRGALFAYQIVAAAIYMLFVAGLIAALLLGRWEPEVLRNLLHRLQETIDLVASRFGRLDALPEAWAERNASDFIGAANDVATNRRCLKRTLAVGMVAQLISVVTIYTISLAYRQPLPLGAVVSAFAIEDVFAVVTVIPSGLVVAETVMALVLNSLGVPFAQSIVITVVYRGLSAWLPVAVGFVSLRYVRSFSRRRREDDGEDQAPS